MSPMSPVVERLYVGIILLLPVSLYTLQQHLYTLLTKHSLHQSGKPYMALNQWSEGIRENRGKGRG